MDDLYGMNGREVEGYVRKHFGFFKVGHARRLAMKVLVGKLQKIWLKKCRKRRF